MQLTSHGGAINHRPGVRRTLAACLLLLVTACGGGGSGSSTGPTKPATPEPPVQNTAKPNVLMIMVDDLGYNDLAINNDNRAIDTPNLDQLAREGMRFTRHYATAVCSPARAALLTGQYPERHGYLPDGRGISPQVTTLPERLQQEGYQTWHIGKWHIGDLQRLAWPDHQGFDHWFGFLNQWRLAGRMENGAIKLVKPRYHNPWLQGDSEPGRHFEGHLESILTTAAADAITTMAEGDAPWFLNLWYYAPHTPIQPAAEFAARYPDTPEGAYRAHVNQLDHNIGQLLAHLDSIGEADNTLVVVVSDNGGTNKQLDNNAPFAGRKGSLHEGGLRTPLLIRWLDEDMNGKVFDGTVTVRDLYPTVLETLGLPAQQNLDGISFLNNARNQAPLPGRALFWAHGGGYGVLSGNGRWRLYTPPAIFGVNLPTELYDLELDRSGGQPIEPLPPARVAQLQGLHQAWHQQVHRVNTQLEARGDGTALLTGMDFMRTPGHGGYTFAMAVAAGSTGNLASQQGIWNLSRSGNVVTANFGELTLSGELDPARGCNSVIISGLFYRHVASFAGGDHMGLNLYINGELQQSVNGKGKLAVADPTLPTVIGDAASAGSAPPQAPQILNTNLETSPVFSAESVSAELCGA